VIDVEAPIGFIHLQEAVRIVGQKMGGDADIERAIAEACEAGDIAAAYRSRTGGADELDRSVWRMPHWRNYFADGMIELILPLLDERDQPNVNGFTARCPREIFVRKDSLDRFIASIEPVSKPAAHSGGRPPEYECVEIKLFFQQLLKERGDPTDEKDHRPGWKSKADAMKVIRDHMEKQGNAVPEKTRFYQVLNEVLSDYRRTSAGPSAN
jgi:hypothetical protein